MQTLEKTLRWIAIASVYCLPFIVFYVASGLFFPFITGKNFGFRILVEVMTAAWLGLALVFPKYRPRRTWLLGAFAVFVLVIAIADAQGAYPFKSFWSNYERMDGWVTLIHLLAYLVVSVSVLNSEKLWRRLFQLSIAISVGVGLYGVLQLFGVRAIGQGGATGLQARLDATLGNAIYLAVYMFFHIFMAGLLWAQEWVERKPGKRNAISIVYGFVIAFDTFILFFTGTRGTILGLVGGAVLAGLIYLLTASNTKRARPFIAGGIAIVVLLSGLLWAARDTEQIKNVGFLVRLANISVNDPTIQSRFLNAQMAWKGVQEHPLLGWGQENYALIFDKYYDPRMHNNEPWFDRTHNIVFDLLVAGGFLGLLSYLAIFAVAIWSLWKGGSFSAAERSILTGLLAGYFFHNLFVFDNVTSYILFVTMLGYIAWRYGESENIAHVTESEAIPFSALPFTAVCSIVIVFSLGWFANASAIGQNQTLIRALIDGSQGNYALALDDFKKAIAYDAMGTQEAREQVIQAASQLSANTSVATELKQQYFNLAASEMKKQSEASPLDARFPLFLGILYGAYGDVADAKTSFDKAHELSPKKQTIIFEMAQSALARGDTNGALANLKLAYEIFPENVDARIYYAAILIRASQDSLADQVLAPIVATGEAADQRIGQAYASRSQYGKIAEIWAARVAARPDDSQAFFTLAAAYYASGNSAKAIEVLKDVATKNPGTASQAESYITQIKNGTAPKP